MKKNAPASFAAQIEPPPLLWSPDPRKKAVKKKPAKEAWHSAFWITSAFQYTPKQTHAIFAPLPKDLHNDAVIRTLQEVAAESLSEQHHGKDKPQPSAVKQQLKELEALTSSLLSCLVSLHSPTMAVLDNTTPPTAVPIPELESFLSNLLSRVRWVDFTYTTPRGRPRNLKLRRFVSRLCDWWKSKTGTAPACQWNRTEEKYEGDFYFFAVAVIVPVYGPDGLDDIIYSVVNTEKKAKQKSKKK